ncbi:MAG: AtpZ/AtpI family protein [Phycisphaeraceae bacterium]|nr:AtpZ/AtpI family protein [Phycisphaeraceae bacterium]
MEFATALLVFGGIGWYLDRRWDCGPWLTLTGSLCGAAVGFYVFIVRARAATRDSRASGKDITDRKHD